MTDEVEQVYQKYWKEIIERPDGSLDAEQVKKELYDFRMLMIETREVYCTLTRGRISKPNTHAEVIIDTVNDLHADDTAEAIKEALEDERENGLDAISEKIS